MTLLEMIIMYVYICTDMKRNIYHWVRDKIIIRSSDQSTNRVERVFEVEQHYAEKFIFLCDNRS